uniref:Uncharacterized protein n=1 Tax=Peronospora matthiolae TaxID=2874970 RepID=A0AAV1UE30_9STRA
MQAGSLIPTRTSDARVNWVHGLDLPMEPGEVVGVEAGATIQTGAAGVPNPVLKVAADRSLYAAAVAGPDARNFDCGESTLRAPSLAPPSIP